MSGQNDYTVYSELNQCICIEKMAKSQVDIHHTSVYTPYKIVTKWRVALNSGDRPTARRAVLLSTPALWEHGHGKQHPLKPERLRRTFELLEEYGAFTAPNVQVIEPEPATEEELALVHSQGYIEVVRVLSGFRDIPNVFTGD